jgi:integrase/recombinase XerD
MLGKHHTDSDDFPSGFRGSGAPVFQSHSFRKTLALFGQEVCQTPEEFKAWSQNLGHESVMTTFSSYGQVAERRQAEIIRSLGREKPSSDGDGNLVREIAKLVARHKGGAASVATA